MRPDCSRGWFEGQLRLRPGQAFSPPLLTRESPRTAVIPASQFSALAINQPGGPAPAGVARWSVMVLFLQTVEGHPYCATQAIILHTASSPLLLPTASGSVTSSSQNPHRPSLATPPHLSSQLPTQANRSRLSSSRPPLSSHQRCRLTYIGVIK